MNRLSRRLEAITALDYKDYEEWKKDFDNESKIEYQALFIPFLPAKKFTVNSIRRFFARRDYCGKRLERLRAWASVDWAKVVRQTPNGVRHPLLLVQQRTHCLNSVIQKVEKWMLFRSDEIAKIASNAKLSMKIKLQLRGLLQLKPHSISSERCKSIENCRVPEHRLIDSAIALAKIGISGKTLPLELAVSQVSRLVLQRYELAKARHYTSALEASFVPRGLPVSTYKLFLSYIRSHVHTLHKYVEVVRRARKVGTIEPDWFGRLPPYRCERQPTLEDAIRLSVTACTPLGAEYMNALHEGLTKHHWVETGDIRKDYKVDCNGWAVCAFGGVARIFFRSKGTLDDVFTIIHEAGHCMHSLLLHRKGSLLRHIDPLVQEGVAKCNEHLLWYELYRRNTDQRAHAYLCCKFLDAIFCRIFVDSMYAELELFLHEVVEKGLRLSSTSVMEKFCELLQIYFGSEVSISSEFLRKKWLGHALYFRRPFRAYDEALTTAASVALAERIVQGGRGERNEYLAMLRSDPMLGPVTIMSRGGVDLTSLSWIDGIMNGFDQRVDTIDGYLKERIIHQKPSS
jgi:hypothetical protein